MVHVHTHSCVKALKNDSDIKEEFLSKFIISGNSHILAFKSLLNTVLKKIKKHESKIIMLNYKNLSHRSIQQHNLLRTSVINF